MKFFIKEYLFDIFINRLSLTKSFEYIIQEKFQTIY